MENKCNKYEGLFTFSSEEELKAHINECEDCRLEDEKMQKVSSLLDEVKLYYYAKSFTSIPKAFYHYVQYNQARVSFQTLWIFFVKVFPNIDIC